MKIYSQNSFIVRMMLNVNIVLGWLIIVPITLLFPRKKGLIITIGRDDNYFLDNVKYFFLHSIKKKNNVYFLTEKKKLSENLKKQLPNILKYPKLKSIILLMRAEYIVVDNAFWFRNYKYYLSIKAKKVQLWHGIGSKKINLSNPRIANSKNKNFKILKGILIGELPKFNLLVSTSKYYTENLFKDAFRYKQIKEFGHPRNDVLFRVPNKFDLIEVENEIYTLLKEKKEAGYKIIIYSPTFRDTGGNVFTDNLINLNSLNNFALKNNFIFVVKFHPFTKGVIEKMSNVLLYDKYKDIYPVLSLANLMITDYSSIYLDFIILNRPIVFFIYDYEKYLTVDRELRADFLDITPGQKCKNELDLLKTLEEILIQNEDTYSSERKQILEMSYKYIDGNSSDRILNFISQPRK